jgi:AcrR family transcriptional regulator
MATDINTSQKWIDAAYREFADYGPEFSIKELAKKVMLPRSTLYYHYGSKENLVQELLDHHRTKIEGYLLEMRSCVKTIIPDLYELMFRHKESILFHQKLLKYGHIKALYALYKEANDSSLDILLPLIRPLFKTEMPDPDIKHFYHSLVDTWYARLDPKQLNVESMTALGVEIMENTLGLYTGASSDQNLK